MKFETTETVTKTGTGTIFGSTTKTRLAVTTAVFGVLFGAMAFAVFIIPEPVFEPPPPIAYPDVPSTLIQGRVIDANTPYWVPTPVIADVNQDGKNDLVAVKDDDHYVAGMNLYVFQTDGTVLPGWPKTLPEVSSLVVGNVVATNTGLEIAAFDGYAVHVFVSNGTELTNGWPRPVPYGNADTLTLGDLENNGTDEILISDFPSANVSRVHAFTATGAEVTGWPKQVTYGVSGITVAEVAKKNSGREVIISQSQASPPMSAVTILRNNGQVLAGWPKTFSQTYINKASVAELTLDGQLDVVVATLGGTVYAYQSTGQTLQGWPVQLANAQALWPVAVANIDAKGADELIIYTTPTDDSGADSSTHILTSVGTELNGWPKELGSLYPALPVDVDANGNVELIYYAWDATSPTGLYLYTADTVTGLSTPWSTFPSSFHYLNSPIVADIDGDRKPEFVSVVQLQEDNSPIKIYPYRMPTASAAAKLTWPMTDHDKLRTSRLDSETTIPVLPKCTTGTCKLLE